MFKNLIELIKSMPTEQQCREYVAQQRWENGKAVCPYCGCGRCYTIEGGKRYKCSEKACFKKFSVTVGTIMEASNIPLSKWLVGIYLVSSHKKGISSYQLGRDLQIAQKNAWFMLHRIREMLRLKENIKLDNIVEIDEVYIGGKVGNMSKTKRKKAREEGTNNHKTMVMGMIERGGNLKLIPVGKANNMTGFVPAIMNNVDNDAVLITDSLPAYQTVAPHYSGHEVVNHSMNEYVRDKTIHTNTIEGAFSLLKRSIYGIYHQVTPKHLSRYCDETMFRYNLRKVPDMQRFIYSLKLTEGRLTWKALTQPVGTENNNQVTKVIVRIKPVYQMLNGEIVAKFDSIKEASIATGINKASIARVAAGIRKNAGGFQWVYA